MDYIDVKQFLEQPKEVQELFIKWWKPNEGDLFYTLDRRYDFKIDRIEGIFDNGTLFDVQNNKGYYKPLLTEGQLRKFIQEKTASKIEIEYFWRANSTIVSLVQPFDDFISSAVWPLPHAVDE